LNCHKANPPPQQQQRDDRPGNAKQNEFLVNGQALYIVDLLCIRFHNEQNLCKPEFHVKIKLPIFSSNWRRISKIFSIVYHFRYHKPLNVMNISREAEYSVTQAFLMHIDIWIFCLLVSYLSSVLSSKRIL
jgi:hypothetical protein